MEYDAFFDTEENKTLTAICIRKLIRNIGIGGIIWGVINLLIGIVAIQVSTLNTGILILGVLMLITGVQALRKPSFEVLKAETLVCALLFLWNLGISVYNVTLGGSFEPRGLIFPLIIAFVMFKYYLRLGHLREQIESVEPENVRQAKQMCNALTKIKHKNDPSVIQTNNGKCRVKFMEKTALFIQRDLMRAFVATKEEIFLAIKNRNVTCLQLQFNHPAGKLVYQLDRKNSSKLKTWLTSDNAQEQEQTEIKSKSLNPIPETILAAHNT